MFICKNCLPKFKDYRTSLLPMSMGLCEECHTYQEEYEVYIHDGKKSCSHQIKST